MTGRRSVPRRRRPKVDVERAQAAARRLLAGACRNMGWLWNRQEGLQAAAVTRQEAMDAVVPLLEVCASCPVVAECRVWAMEDSYTGVAAGAAWQDGQERPYSWIPGHPLRQQAS